MKKMVSKYLVMAGTTLLLAPAALLAQKTDKEKEKSDKKEMQMITITRNTDSDEKTVIEINGDKVKINGKDAGDNKDVKVNVHKMKAFPRIADASGTYSFNFNGDHLFTTDENRAMLGVTTESDEKGARIQSVTKKSAAEKAGIQKGDIITKIDNKKIEAADEVTEAIRSHKPGDKVAITLMRDGKEQKLSAELGKWEGVRLSGVTAPRLPQLAETLNGQKWQSLMDGQGLNNVYIASTRGPRLGLSIQDVDEGNGVKVLDVDEESNAAKAGIMENDIITDVDGTTIKGTEDITKIIRGADKEKRSYQFKVMRGGKAQTIEVKIPRKLKTADL